MREAIHVHQVVVKQGQIQVTGLPFRDGQLVEVILLPPPQMENITKKPLTVQAIRQSGLIGLWKNRDDIVDSAAYARQLREQIQQRGPR